MGAAGEGEAATLCPRLPRVPRLRTVRVASLRKAPLTARSGGIPAQRQPAFCPTARPATASSRPFLALVFTSPTVPGRAGLVHGLLERRVETARERPRWPFLFGGYEWRVGLSRRLISGKAIPLGSPPPQAGGGLHVARQSGKAGQSGRGQPQDRGAPAGN
jgi:hypothetical protein